MIQGAPNPTCAMPAARPEVGRFCLSANLERYFELRGEVLHQWQALLAMETIGFSYSGLDSAASGILNGLGGSTDELLANLCRCIGVRKTTHTADVLHENGPPVLLMVDDFYVPYSEVRGRQHSKRFIVAESLGESRLFDLRERLIDRNEIAPAVLEYFTLEADSDAMPTAMDAALRQTWHRNWQSPDTVGRMRRFYGDVERSALELAPEQYFALFFDLRRPSGPAVIRWQTGEALHELDQACGSARNADLAASLKLAAEQWHVVGNLCFKLSIDPRESAANSMLRRLSAVLDLEHELALRAAGGTL